MTAEKHSEQIFCRNVTYNTRVQKEYCQILIKQRIHC